MLFRKNLFFTIARIVSIFFMGMVVAVVIALSQVNLETLRGDILGILRGATGLDIEIDGAVSWKFSLRPRIELHQVRVRNADWARHEYAFSAETSLLEKTKQGSILFRRTRKRPRMLLRIQMRAQHRPSRLFSRNILLPTRAWAG